MPLPAALLARLKRRGIVQEGDEEEVIAESYDDDSKTSTTRRQAPNAAGAPGCPNKWNPYHCCVEFCYDHWREGTPENRLSVEYNRRRVRMLKKYPLPNGWKEVYDPGVSRHYYWNTETDEVSWLSPAHPKAIIGEAAPKLGRSVFEKVEYQKEVSLAKVAQQEAAWLAGKRKRRPKEPTPEPQPSSDSDSSDEGEKGEDGEEIELSTFEKLKRAKRRGIDPMDPAAYGDCTAGKWSSGLDGRGEAKTGVDSSASGPLFQSRPYPAPGAILRKNAELSKK